MQRWMTAYGHALEAMPTLIINNFQQIMFTIERIKTDIKREMLTIIRQEPRLGNQLAIIETVPGIADTLGIIILAEFGDFHRFTNADAVACWTGLTERSHVSNRQKYPGKISKAGSTALR
ncbi:MAG: transposase [Actinobacteria bacterium]|nr:transposase [Actinomycetota bacterium]